MRFARYEIVVDGEHYGVDFVESVNGEEVNRAVLARGLSSRSVASQVIMSIEKSGGPARVR